MTKDLLTSPHPLEGHADCVKLHGRSSCTATKELISSVRCSADISCSSSHALQLFNSKSSAFSWKEYSLHTCESQRLFVVRRTERRWVMSPFAWSHNKLFQFISNNIKSPFSTTIFCTEAKTNRFLQSPAPLPPHPPYSRSPANRSLALRLLVILQLLTGVTMQCLVDKCATDFTRSMDVGKVIVGPNYRYCLLLQEYTECLKRTSRACRGDLKYHSLFTLLMSQNKDMGCPQIVESGPPRHPIRVYGHGGSGGDDIGSGDTNGYSTTFIGGTQQHCDFPFNHHNRRGPANYRHCGVFGDPHLRTFDGQYETCKALGAWPLVDNSYLGVQVTNEPVGLLVATAISKITVIVKSLTGCTQQKTYEATRDHLPSVFDDGTSGSIDHTVNSRHNQVVHIKTIQPDAHIEIVLRYISTKVVIRRAGGYLSFAVRIPEEVIDQHSSISALQLCLTGCPVSQKIGYKEILAYPDYFVRSLVASPDNVANTPVDPQMPRDQAEQLCRDAGVTDFYFDSCVFDLLLTGDRNVVASAVAAQDDVRTLYPPYRRHYEANRTSLAIYEEMGRAAIGREAVQFRRDSAEQVYYSSAAAKPNLCCSTSMTLLVLVVLMLVAQDCLLLEHR